ncbi:hypothetical protein NA57DRAFT_53046 [Rhizodiscina lignyota]|uniref:Peptidase M20 domain-containing protein 2 n=1 Tax=Rhizodiscina lignyota TaxID=1504668 RepID=A0A9P4MDJ9_9PEZI|nr:hypothetical protein NA57DRAFT_53046 [Rhizodiscina lignyota]
MARIYTEWRCAWFGLILVTLLSGSSFGIPTEDVSTLPKYLQSLEHRIYPDLREISKQIYHHPEIGRNETFAHAITVDYFQNRAPGDWNVYPNILETLPTAWKLESSHKPSHWHGKGNKILPAVGFLCEFDALAGIGHSCGHNLIHLVGVYAASLAREALVHYNIPGRIVVVGTPDEEESCGKHDLFLAGAFEDSQIWMMAHPASSSAVPPLSARQNVVVRIKRATHFEAVKEVYNTLVLLRNLSLTGTLPGSFSTVSLIEDVGLFVCNVVQADIALGVVGANVTVVNNTINAIKAANAGYAQTNFTVTDDPNIKGGVAISFVGNSGHTATDNLGSLTLSVDSFRTLNASNPNLKFYLPDNSTSTELDFTIDLRTRYTLDMDSLIDIVVSLLPTNNWSLDVIYPAVEVEPYLGSLFIDTMTLPEYGNQTFPFSTTPPAAGDTSWVQRADVVKQGGNYTLQSVAKATVHPTFNICNYNRTVTPCPLNHEPGFRLLAATEFAFRETEKVGRALAQMAVELLNDPDVMAGATAIIRTGPDTKF